MWRDSPAGENRSWPEEENKQPVKVTVHDEM
jgi:hypothetical protein